MSGEEPRINVYQERIFPVLFMLFITAVFIALVSGIYLATRENVLSNEQRYLKKAVLYAAGIETPEATEAGADLFEERYEQRIREVAAYNESGELIDVVYYEVSDSDGNIVGFVIPAEGPGLWGEIEAVIGFDAELSILTGVDFIKQNETPGLGGRIAEPWFRSQFRGKAAPLSRVAEGTMSADTHEFDAITGATITSTAVETIINSLSAEASDIIEGARR